jgi:tRNA pseudouridine38-40 synthase
VRRNIKLVISYDGTEFSGWQIQSSDRSVQGVMTEALSDLHQEAVSITGAGRTDSGVHAVGQVGNFYTEKDTIPDWKFRDALNARLPRDIRILSSVEVPRDFHSRRDACFRQYEYRMIEGPVGPAHMARFTWLIRRMPSLVALNDMPRLSAVLMIFRHSPPPEMPADRESAESIMPRFYRILRRRFFGSAAMPFCGGW